MPGWMWMDVDGFDDDCDASGGIGVNDDDAGMP